MKKSTLFELYTDCQKTDFPWVHVTEEGVIEIGTLEGLYRIGGCSRLHITKEEGVIAYDGH
jgi:hypothetical protein